MSNSKNATEKTSVIIPCYNYARYLTEAVESILDQTFQDFEIIIINDGSTDNTKLVAERVVAKYPAYQIRLINQANAGQPAISRNRGIAEASGKYILCLDADDMILPTMLEKCLNLLERNKDIAIAYTDRLDFDGVDRVVPAGDYDFSRLKYANQISYCALFRKEIWEAVGGYRTNIKGCEDWDFWIAAGARGYFGRRIPEPLFKYRRHDTGVYQEVLKNYPQKHAQIILNNPEAFAPSEISRAKKKLGCKSREEPRAGALVSVIVPTFNRPQMLKVALESILSQNYQDFEIIVVNDGGVDVSELIQNFQDPRIKYFQQKRKTGPAAARNTGIKNATGKYIALLDDDDIFYPEHLETAVKYINDQYPVVYTDAVRASYAKHGETYKLVRKSVPYSMAFDRNKLLIGNISPINCFVFDKQLAIKAGLFIESLRTLEDWDFWIRLSSLAPFKHIARATVQVNWRNDGTTMTSSLGHEFKINREKIYKKYQNEIKRIPNIKEISEEFNYIWTNDWKELPQLISIVILTFNQIYYTKKCIESVLKHTKEHFELIVVDNGSTDGTIEYLESLSRNQKPETRIKILPNKYNLGFAAGNNQGIAEAKGDYILLLNNDVVVTRGWLQKLVTCAEQDPKIGLVGPLTNYAAGPQRVSGVAYNLVSLAGLEQFAAELAEKNNGRSILQWPIVGFCMLIKRNVIEKIGGLDLRYGLGNFEDDDFCIRARLAGFKAQIAQDCFVHHFGGKTFGGAKINYQESLNKNWKIFKKKWNIPAHTPLGLTYRVDLPREGFNPQKHYCSLIVKNYSKNTLQGGNDVENYEKMYQSIQLMLNSSNSEDAIAALKNLVDSFPDFAQAHNDLGVLLYQNGEKESALEHYERARLLDGGNSTFKKNLADFYYVEQGRVEEALELYVDVLALNPQDVETLLIIGHICVGLQRFDDAEVFYNRVLEIEPGNGDARQLLEKIQNSGQSQSDAETPEERYQQIQSQMKSNNPQTVVGLLKDLLVSFPNFALAHNDLGVLHYNAGDKDNALTHYEQAAQLEPDNITFKKNLADFYFVEQNRVEDALKLYVDVLTMQPDDVETLLITGHICVSLQRFDDAKVFYNRVLEIEPWNTDARQNLDILESKREAV